MLCNEDNASYPSIRSLTSMTSSDDSWPTQSHLPVPTSPLAPAAERLPNEGPLPGSEASEPALGPEGLDAFLANLLLRLILAEGRR